MKLTLNEDLFDIPFSPILPDVIIGDDVLDNTVTTTPDPGVDIGISNLIINAINDEWEAISTYNDMLSNVDASMIPVLQDIIAEENKHVGQL